MSNKLQTLSGEDAKKYERTLAELEELISDIKNEYRKILKPITSEDAFKSKRITKRDVTGSIGRINTALEQLNVFSNNVEKFYAPMFDWIAVKHHTAPKKSPKVKPPKEEPEQILEELELEEDYDPTDDLLKKKSNLLRQSSSSAADTLQKLKNLTYDFDSIRDVVDQKYIHYLNMSPEKFRVITNKLLPLRELVKSKKPTTAAVDHEDEDFFSGFERQVSKITPHEYLEDKDIHTAIKKIKDGIPWKREGELISPNLIFDAWEYLQGQLEAKYEAFVKTFVGMTLSNLSQDELDQKTVLSPHEQQARSTILDSRIIKSLSNAMRTLE